MAQETNSFRDLCEIAAQVPKRKCQTSLKDFVHNNNSIQIELLIQST